MRQFTIRLYPEPDLLIQQRASSIEGAIKAAIHFHGRDWKKYTNRHGGGMVTCTPRVCDVAYDRLVFSPGLRHRGQRIYRANPFDMILAGEKTTTVRRSRDMGDAKTGPDPYPAHNVGDLLEAAQGGMRSGLIVEIMDVPEWDAEHVTPEMARNDGFTGDEAGAQLMADFIAAEGGPMDLYVFRYRPDLSSLPEPAPGPAAGYASGAIGERAVADE